MSAAIGTGTHSEECAATTSKKLSLDHTGPRTKEKFDERRRKLKQQKKYLGHCRKRSGWGKGERKGEGGGGRGGGVVDGLATFFFYITRRRGGGEGGGGLVHKLASMAVS